MKLVREEVKRKEEQYIKGADEGQQRGDKGEGKGNENSLCLYTCEKKRSEKSEGLMKGWRKGVKDVIAAKSEPRR